MILLTLNIRGVGGAPKFAYVRRLLVIIKLGIIFLQETLVSKVKAR